MPGLPVSVASVVTIMAIVAIMATMDIATPASVVSVAPIIAMISIPSTVSSVPAPSLSSSPIVPLLAASVRPPVVPSLRPPVLPPASLPRVVAPCRSIVPTCTAPVVPLLAPVLLVLLVLLALVVLFGSMSLPKRPAVLLPLLFLLPIPLLLLARTTVARSIQPLLAVLIARAAVIHQLVLGHPVDVFEFLMLKRALVGLERGRVEGILDGISSMSSMSSMSSTSSALPAARFAFSAAARLAPDAKPARGPVHLDGCLSGKPPGAKHTFRVEANYLGSTINVYDLVKLDQYKDSFKAVHKGAALIGLRGDNWARAGGPARDEGGEEASSSFVAVTSYGSAVFFDTPKELKERCLSLLLNKNASVVSEPLKDHTLYKEEFAVTIDPGIAPRWSILENPDCIVLQKMDVMNLQTISHVLAQSVALDFYSNHVEKTLETFCSLNQEMMESSNIGKLNKQVLLQLVAENNIVMSDIISKLGVHERFDVAWREAKYGELWDYLRTELEIESRFETLDMKLDLVQGNLKYILQLHQERKSVALEWTIIVVRFDWPSDIDVTLT